MKISVSLIKEGMILENDVYTSNGNFLLSKGIKLTSLLIKRLKNEKIEEIDILVPKKKSEPISNNKIEMKKFGQPEIKEDLEKSFNKVTASIKKLTSNLNLEGDKIDKVAKNLLNFIENSFDKHLLYVLENVTSTRESNDPIFDHMVNVSILSFMIGKWLGFDKEKLDKLTLAALFHDIGMLKIPESLINKKDKLTMYELWDIRKHTTHTYQILTKWNCFDEDIVNGAVHHHEKIDGTGYPDKLTGNNINEFSRIIAVADVFDALTSKKTYRASFSSLKALEELNNESGSKLDPNITRLFITKFFENYLGQGVKLSNNSDGKIIRLNPNQITKPLIACTNGKIIDLSTNKSVFITEFL